MGEINKTGDDFMNGKATNSSIIQGFLLMTGILGVVGIFIKYILVDFIEKISKIVFTTDAVIIIAIMSAVVSIFTLVYGKYIDNKQKTNRYLYGKREEPYSQFIGMVYNILQSKKIGKSYSEHDMLEDLFKFSQQITIWGSNEVIQKWNRFRNYSIKREKDPTLPSENILFILEDIIYAIRKDMGHKDKVLKRGELLSLFVNDIDEALEKRQNK